MDDLDESLVPGFLVVLFSFRFFFPFACSLWMYISLSFSLIKSQ
jgi:hypothetical protein